jgi:hypothetical protein
MARLFPLTFFQLDAFCLPRATSELIVCRSRPPDVTQGAGAFRFHATGGEAKRPLHRFHGYGVTRRSRVAGSRCTAGCAASERFEGSGLMPTFTTSGTERAWGKILMHYRI